MVFFYTLGEKATKRGFKVYMGRDKWENEELLQHGWPEDVWFHVDNLSSAHVYLRMPNDGCTWDNLPPAVINQCCQIVKNNSIEGCKRAEVAVIYTPFLNLHKDPQTMQAGAVAYHDRKKVKRVMVQKNRELTKKLEKTKSVDTAVDHVKLRRIRDDAEMKLKKKFYKAEMQKKKALEKKNKEEAYAKSYDRLFEDDDGDMEGNSDKKKAGVNIFGDDDDDDDDDDDGYNMDDLADLL